MSLARHLRAQADSLPGASRHPRTAGYLARESAILASATSLMATHGRHALSIAALAAAMRLSAPSIRRHFPDMSSLLAEILVRHMQAISTAMAAAAEGAQDKPACRLAAYIAATRTEYGDLKDAHRLLVRERHTLPADLSIPVEQLRHTLGHLLAGPHAELALALLDEPAVDATRAAAILNGLQNTPHPDAPRPRDAAPPASPLPPGPQAPAAPDLRQNRTARPLAKRGKTAPPGHEPGPASHKPARVTHFRLRLPDAGVQNAQRERPRNRQPVRCLARTAALPKQRPPPRANCARHITASSERPPPPVKTRDGTCGLSRAVQPKPKPGMHFIRRLQSRRGLGSKRRTLTG